MLPTAIHHQAIDAANDADRAWFAVNSDRNFRLREMVDYEFNEPWTESPLPGFVWRVVVVRMGDGARLRWPLTVNFTELDVPDEAIEPIFRQFAAPEAVAFFDGRDA